MSGAARARFGAFALALLGAFGVASGTARATAPSVVALRAAGRAEGNDRAAAVALATALLAREWPAQVLKVRVDAIGGHRVAGLLISGVKFHAPLDEAGFLREVSAIVEQSFAASDVEEVDVWTVVPLDAGKGAIVSGDLAKPTSLTVYTVTIPRAQRARIDAIVRDPSEVFWDPAWRASLDTGTPTHG